MRRRARLGRRQLIPLLVVAIVAAGIGVAADLTGALRSLELQSVALRYSIRGARHPRPDIAVVAVDGVTLQQLHLRWPFPRRLHAQLIDRLRRAGARTIAFDVEFIAPTDARDDNALIGAITHAADLVLATVRVGPHGSTLVLGGGGELHAVHAVAGYAGFPTGPGGAYGRMYHNRAGLASFGVAAARGAGVKAPTRGAPEWIDFAGPPETYPTYSYSKVLRGQVPPSAFAGKVVVVGATDPSLGDRHVTLAATDQPMAGPEIQANAIATALEGFPLQSLGKPGAILLILLCGLVPLLAVTVLRDLAAAAVTLLFGLLYLVAAQLLFNNEVIAPVTYPVLTLALSATGAVTVLAVRVAFEREHTRRAFARFVPQDVADEVIRRLGSETRLGGTCLEATVLFSDLRGFTSFAESREPEEVISILNRYLTTLSDAILDERGTLVTYLGDGIMAVFGAPVATPDHADRGLRAALEMLARGRRLGEELRQAGICNGFELGIGLCSGQVMSGNVGSERRLEYTALGDTTNVAARLQAQTKEIGGRLLMADTTKCALTQAHPELRSVGDVTLRGRGEPVPCWQLACETPPATT